METKQTRGETIKRSKFKIDSPQFRRRVKRTKRTMEENKSAGADRMTAEILETTPDTIEFLMYRLLDTV